MNIWNTVKLGGIDMLEKQWESIPNERIRIFIGQINVSIMLLEHGLRFEKWRDVIQVSQWIQKLYELQKKIVQRCTELWISI